LNCENVNFNLLLKIKELCNIIDIRKIFNALKNTLSISNEKLGNSILDGVEKMKK